MGMRGFRCDLGKGHHNNCTVEPATEKEESM